MQHVFYARANMVVIGRGKNLRLAFKPSKRLGMYNFSLIRIWAVVCSRIAFGIEYLNPWQGFVATVCARE